MRPVGLSFGYSTSIHLLNPTPFTLTHTHTQTLVPAHPLGVSGPGWSGRPPMHPAEWTDPLTVTN